MKKQERGALWPRILIVSVAMICALAVGWIFVVGPDPEAYFNPDPCFDAEGVMVSCKG